MKKWLGFGPRYLLAAWQRLAASLTVRRLIWGLVFFAVTVLLVGLDTLPPDRTLQVGQPSPEDFLARQTLTYESQVLTARAREEAARRVAPLYRLDAQALRAMEQELDRLLNEVERVRASEQGPLRVQQLLGEQLTLGEARAALAASEADRRALGEKLKELLRLTLGLGVNEQGLAAIRSVLLQQAGELEVVPELKPLARALLARLELRPTLTYDLEGTRLRVEEAQARVAPVQVTVRAGEKIVGKGELVTEQQIEALQHLGLLRSPSAFASFFGIVMLVGVLYLLLALYLWSYQREIFRSESRLVLLGILVVLGVALGRAIMAIDLGGDPETASLVGYMIPTAASSMLIAILLDSRLGVFCTVMLGLLVGLLTGGNLAPAVVATVGGLTGVYSVSHLSQRTDLVKASLYIILANLVCVCSLGLLQGYSGSGMAIGALLSLANGVLSSVLTIGSLPFFEGAFGLTTSVKLLELANPNQPLLRRLLLEAPGTYHHSLMVANLAEVAADALGADALLARVGGYYHDIGKLRRPYFFIENQVGGENPHDKLNPGLSTLIITAHVKDGLEMAREARLPAPITDMIAQHHGSSVVSYFYHKAARNGSKEPVQEDDFRYDAPKPRTKEAAILMLADSVEAGARSLQKPSPNRLEGLVRKVIKEKLEDGQLDECPLTFQELDQIAQAFTRALSGIFHSRIEYPESVLKEMERRKARDAALRKQSTG
ncbi:MAG: HD family phosphohydrolase [Moorellales bacterium]